MTQKELYTSPEVAVLTLQSEGVVCQSVTSITTGNAIEPITFDNDPFII